jgi:hypothetical protein
LANRNLILNSHLSRLDWPDGRRPFPRRIFASPPLHEPDTCNENNQELILNFDSEIKLIQNVGVFLVYGRYQM